MSRRNSAVFGVLCLSAMAVDGTARQPCSQVRVPGVQSVFALAPAPVGRTVLFYASTEPLDGEYYKGALFRLRLDGIEGKVYRVNAPLATNPSAPVWQPDGSVAYFETNRGIHQLGAGTDTPQLLWKGTAAGLAISPNGALLAFWHLGDDAYTLVLLDVKRRAEVRTWRLESRYGADRGEFRLAFAPDGSALYAVTYDQLESTPLKRFDLTTGRETLVYPHCLALAAGKAAVYFVAVSGRAMSLDKIVGGIRPSAVASEFCSHRLAPGGNRRWLLSQDFQTKEVSILDTQTDSIEQLGKHDSAGMLPDGTFLFVNGPEITVGGLPCKSGRRE